LRASGNSAGGTVVPSAERSVNYVAFDEFSATAGKRASFATQFNSFRPDQLPFSLEPRKLLRVKTNTPDSSSTPEPKSKLVN
jgi:hypothetical protein